MTLAVLALVLAAAGIYGLTLHAVTPGPARSASGSRWVDAAPVLRVTIGEGVRLCAIGIGLGLLGAIAAGRAAHALLFGVGAADPLALGATIAVLVAVTLGVLRAGAAGHAGQSHRRLARVLAPGAARHGRMTVPSRRRVVPHE